jgi:hypothetical protein
MSKENIVKRKKGNPISIMLFIIVLVLSLLNGYFYFQLSAYNDLKSEYDSLYNRTVIQEIYYDNLSSMYSEIRLEYDQLSSNYKDLLQKYYNLSREYEDILKYEKEETLVVNESIVLPIKSNSTYTYELPFSGYIVMNYSADDDVYVWIGSSMVDGVYFARYPQFPETAESASFIVPVAPDLHVFIGNPNEFNEARVSFSIKFVY